MRGEFSVRFTRKSVSVAQGIVTIKSPEITDIVRQRSHKPTFALDVTVEEWNDVALPARFRVTGLGRSAYRVTDQHELHIAVPELADLVRQHRDKKNFVLEVHVADDGWLAPPATLTPP